LGNATWQICFGSAISNAIETAKPDTNTLFF
jgi:hypothetical protein